jgi:glycosyltransferase involved in cell wall biosynthesis
VSTPSVLFISTWQTQCGIATYTAGLRKGLEELGVECDVRPINRRELAYLTRSELHDHFEEMARSAADHDVVHIQHELGFFQGPYGYQVSTNVFGHLLACLRGRAAVVVTFHSHPVVPTWRGLPWQKAVRQTAAHLPWRNRVAREFNRGGAIAVAPSRVLRRTLIDSGISADRVIHIPQGSPPFNRVGSRDQAAAKAELGYRPDDRVVLLFGFVTTHKGHHVALDALAALPARYHLAMVGGPHPLSNDGYYEELLTALSHQREVARRVRLTGYVPHDEVLTYFAAADVCVLPYLEHGLATSAAAVWALTSARPVIGTKIPALVEIEEEGECLRLVTPRAARELAAAIVEVDRDEQVSKTLVSNAAAYCERTAWPVIARRHLEAYERELAGRGRRP